MEAGKKIKHRSQIELKSRLIKGACLGWPKKSKIGSKSLFTPRFGKRKFQFERTDNESGKMFTILMVCTGNICRSPMAEGLLRHHLPKDLKERINVASAGIHALIGNHAEPHAVQAVAGLGIDIGKHRARQLTRDIANSADLILGMERIHLSPIKRALGWRKPKPRLITEFDPQPMDMDIQDPYGRQFEAYEACLQSLKPCIKGLILWLGNSM